MSLSRAEEDVVPAAAEHLRRIAELVPMPTWTPETGWEIRYVPMCTVQNQARLSSLSSEESLAQVVSMQGSTTAGKSWLLAKLLSADSDKPWVASQVGVQSAGGEDDGEANLGLLDAADQAYDPGLSTSTTGDVNLFEDNRSEVFFVDYEGTDGTDPKVCMSKRIYRWFTRGWDSGQVKTKRTHAVKEYFPRLAYLTSHVVIYVCKQGLVSSSAVKECEEMAQRATLDLGSAPKPALFLVHNQCRKEEVRSSAKVTEDSKTTHADLFDMLDSKFKSVHCFTIPVESEHTQLCRAALHELKTTLANTLQGVNDADALQYTQREWLTAFAMTCACFMNGRWCDPYAVRDEIRSRASIGAVDVMASFVAPLLKAAFSSDLAKRQDITDECIEELGRVAALLNVEADLAAPASPAATDTARRVIVSRAPSGQPEVGGGSSGGAMDASSSHSESSETTLLQDFARLLWASQLCCEPVDNPKIIAYRNDGPVVCGCRREGHGVTHRSALRVRWDKTGMQGISKLLQEMSEWFEGGFSYEWRGLFRDNPDGFLPALIDLSGDESGSSAAQQRQVESSELSDLVRRIRESQLEWRAQLHDAPWPEKAKRFCKRLGIQTGRAASADGRVLCAVCVRVCGKPRAAADRRGVIGALSVAAGTLATWMGIKARIFVCEDCCEKYTIVPTTARDPTLCIHCNAAGSSHRVQPCGHRFCSKCAHDSVRGVTLAMMVNYSPRTGLGRHRCPACSQEIETITDESAVHALLRFATSSSMEQLLFAREPEGLQAEEVKGLWRLLADAGLSEVSVGNAVSDWCRQQKCSDVLTLTTLAPMLFKDLRCAPAVRSALQQQLTLVAQAKAGVYMEFLMSMPCDSRDESGKFKTEGDKASERGDSRLAALCYAKSLHYSPLSEELVTLYGTAWEAIARRPSQSPASLATSRFHYVYQERRGFASRNIREALHEVRVFCLAACCSKGYPLAEGLQLYKNIERNVMTGLDDLPAATMSTMMMPVVISRAWTTPLRKAALRGTEFCSLLCEAIREDGRLVDFAVPVVSTMNEYLVNSATRAGRMPAQVTHRGIRIPEGQLGFWTPGKKYRVPMPLASSLREGVAQNFAKHRSDGKVGLLFQFEFSELGCCHCQYLEDITTASGEHEVLFPPYSTFTVKTLTVASTGACTQVVLAVAKDNKDESDHLELSVWH